MGYESRIYIVRKSELIDDGGKRYAQEIARFNMGKIPDVSSILRNMPKTDCYICADDGSTEVIEDKYGEELTECTPSVLAYTITHNDGGYWRYNLLLPVLKELAELKDDTICCLHYGY